MAVKLIKTTPDGKYYSLNDSVTIQKEKIPGSKTKGSKNLFKKLTSYSKNVLKSTKDLAFSVADSFVPSVKELKNEIKDVGIAATNDVKQTAAPYLNFIKQQKTTDGSIIKNATNKIKLVSKEVTHRVSTGEFYKDPSKAMQEQMAKQFGNFDDFGDFGNDSSFDFSEDQRGPSSYKISSAPDVLSDEPFGGVSKGVTRKINVTQNKQRSITPKHNPIINVGTNVPSASSVTKGDVTIAETSIEGTRAIIAEIESVYTRNQLTIERHNRKLVAYQDNILKSINALVEFQNNVTSKQVEAQMEYQAKSIAAKEDTINHMKELKDMMVVLHEEKIELDNKTRNLYNKNKNQTSILDSGEDYWKNVKENIQDTPIGSILGMLPIVGDMLSTSADSGMQFDPINSALQFAIKSRFSNKTKSRLAAFNDIVSNIGPLSIGKLNQMQRFGNSTLSKTIGKLLGQRDTRIKQMEFGIEGDITNQVNWTAKSDRTLNEVIPALLNKQLAALTGKDEMYYDYKEGKFFSVKYKQQSVAAQTESFFQDPRATEISNKVSELSEANNEFESVMRSALEKTVKNGKTLTGREIDEIISNNKGKFKEHLQNIQKNLVKSNTPFDPDLIDNVEFRKLALGNDFKNPIAVAALTSFKKIWTTKFSENEQLKYNAGITNAHFEAQKKIKSMNSDILTYGGATAVAESVVKDEMSSMETSLKNDLKFNLKSGVIKGTSAYVRKALDRLEFQHKLNMMKFANNQPVYDEKGKELDFNTYFNKYKNELIELQKQQRQASINKSALGMTANSIIFAGADAKKDLSKLNISTNRGLDIANSVMASTFAGSEHGEGILSSENEYSSSMVKQFEVIEKFYNEKIEKLKKKDKLNPIEKAQLNMLNRIGSRIKKQKESYIQNNEPIIDENGNEIPPSKYSDILKKNIEDNLKKISASTKTKYDIFTKGTTSRDFSDQLVDIFKTTDFSLNDDVDEQQIKGKVESKFGLLGGTVDNLSISGLWTVSDSYSLTKRIPGLLSDIKQLVSEIYSSGIGKGNKIPTAESVSSSSKSDQKRLSKKERKRLSSEYKNEEIKKNKSYVKAKSSIGVTNFYDEMNEEEKKEYIKRKKKHISNKNIYSKIASDTYSEMKNAISLNKKRLEEEKKLAEELVRLVTVEGYSITEAIEKLGAENHPYACFLADKMFKESGYEFDYNYGFYETAKNIAKIKGFEFNLPTKPGIIVNPEDIFSEENIDNIKDKIISLKDTATAVKDDITGASFYGNQAKKHKWNAFGAPLAFVGHNLERSIGVGASTAAGGYLGGMLGSALLGPLGGIAGAALGAKFSRNISAKHAGIFNVAGKATRAGIGVAGVGASALGGAKVGAALGSFLGPLGTLVGGVGGAAAGGIGSYMFGKGVMSLFKQKYPNLRASLVADGFVDAPKMKLEDLYAVVTNIPGERGEGLRGSSEYAKLQKEVYNKPIRKIVRAIAKPLKKLHELSKYTPENLKYRDVIRILNNVSEEKYYTAEPALIHSLVKSYADSDDKDKNDLAESIMSTKGWKKLDALAKNNFVKKTITEQISDDINNLKNTIVKWGKLHKYTPLLEVLDANGFSSNVIDDKNLLLGALKSLEKEKPEIYRIVSGSKLYAKLEKDIKKQELKAEGLGFVDRFKELRKFDKKLKNRNKFSIFTNILHNNGITDFDDKDVEQIYMALMGYFSSEEGKETAKSIKRSKLYKQLCQEAGFEYDGLADRQSESAVDGVSNGKLDDLKKRIFKVAGTVGITEENIDKVKAFVTNTKDQLIGKDNNSVTIEPNTNNTDTTNVTSDDKPGLLSKTKGIINTGLGKAGEAAGAVGGFLGKIFGPKESTESIVADKVFTSTVTGAASSKENMNGSMVKKARMGIKIHPIAALTGLVAGITTQLGRLNEGIGIDQKGNIDPTNKDSIAASMKNLENKSGGGGSGILLMLSKIVKAIGGIGLALGGLGIWKHGKDLKDRATEEGRTSSLLYALGFQNESESQINAFGNVKSEGELKAQSALQQWKKQTLLGAHGGKDLVKNSFNAVRGKTKLQQWLKTKAVEKVGSLVDKADDAANAVSKSNVLNKDAIKTAVFDKAKDVGKNAFGVIKDKVVSVFDNVLKSEMVQRIIGTKVVSKIKGFFTELVPKFIKTVKDKLGPLANKAGNVGSKFLKGLGRALNIAAIIYSFVNGAMNAPRYFTVAEKDCTFGMKATSCLVEGIRTTLEVVSGILLNILLPGYGAAIGAAISIALAFICPVEKMIVDVYKLFAGEEGKAELERKQNEYRAKAEKMGVSVEALNTAENLTLGNKAWLGIKSIFSGKTYEQLKDERTAKILGKEVPSAGSGEGLKEQTNDVNVTADPNKPIIEKLDDKVACWLTPSSDGNWFPVGDLISVAKSCGYMWPHTNKYKYACTSPFGERTQPISKNKSVFHCGVDMRCRHDRLYAFCSGTVIYAGFTSDDFGGTVVIRGDNGVIAVTAHHRDIKVKTGEQVKVGQYIGTSGGDPHDPGDRKGVGVNANGYPASTGLHLHFSVIVGKIVVDPIGFVLNGCQFTDDIKSHELYGVLKRLLENTCKIDFSGKQEEIMNGDLTTDVAPEASLADAAKEAGMSKTDMAKLGNQTSKGHDYTTKVNTNSSTTTSNSNNNGSTAATAVKASAKETPVSISSDTNSLLARALDIQNSIYKEQVRHNAIVESFIKLMTSNNNPNKAMNARRDLKEKIDSISPSLVDGADRNAVGL